ncbi:MAG TPA: M28 family peptidase [Tepidisphaeraceae bacterium]|nr:M28 family peptidase [Tepidisphaeraceae bacterium]
MGRADGFDESEIERRLRAHVDLLAGVIGERNAWRRPGALEGAARYIEDQFRAMGYEPGAQRFMAKGYSPDSMQFAADEAEVRNIEVEIRGERRPGRVWVIGAHYDTVDGSPGADDNTSAVAGLLEVGRMMRGLRLRDTLRLVAFVNEEPPYYKGDQMGSLVYARRCKERREDVRGMVNLEMLGCYSDEPGSQLYPPPLDRGWWNKWLPKRGNFVAFAGNLGSWWLTRRCRKLFKREVTFPSMWVAAPGRLKNLIGMSDHWSFWEQGYKAVMVTDTAFLRYRHYHKESDTPEKLDYARMATVVRGVGGVMGGLVGARPR